MSLSNVSFSLSSTAADAMATVGCTITVLAKRWPLRELRCGAEVVVIPDGLAPPASALSAQARDLQTLLPQQHAPIIVFADTEDLEKFVSYIRSGLAATREQVSDCTSIDECIAAFVREAFTEATGNDEWSLLVSKLVASAIRTIVRTSLYYIITNTSDLIQFADTMLLRNKRTSVIGAFCRIVDPAAGEEAVMVATTGTKRAFGEVSDSISTMSMERPQRGKKNVPTGGAEKLNLPGNLPIKVGSAAAELARKHPLRDLRCGAQVFVVTNEDLPNTPVVVFINASDFEKFITYIRKGLANTLGQLSDDVIIDDCIGAWIFETFAEVTANEKWSLVVSRLVRSALGTIIENPFETIQFADTMLLRHGPTSIVGGLCRIICPKCGSLRGIFDINCFITPKIDYMAAFCNCGFHRCACDCEFPHENPFIIRSLA